MNAELRQKLDEAIRISDIYAEGARSLVDSLQQKARELAMMAYAVEELMCSSKRNLGDRMREVDELAAETVQNEVKSNRIDSIFDAVCAKFHVSRTELTGTGRNQKVAFARHIAMHLFRTMTSLSFPEIGRLFNRDHSTTIHGCAMIRKRIDIDPSFAATLVHLQEKASDTTFQVKELLKVLEAREEQAHFAPGSCGKCGLKPDSPAASFCAISECPTRRVAA